MNPATVSSQRVSAARPAASAAVSSQVLHARLLQLAEAERRAPAARRPRQRADLALSSSSRDSEVSSSCDTLCIVSWDEEATTGGGELWQDRERP